MNTYKILVLTDHSGHSDQNSIYALLREMSSHHKCQYIDVASRGLEENHAFFSTMHRDGLLGSRVTDTFGYTPDGDSFKTNLKKLKSKDYNFLFLRLPRPISDDFLLWISEVFSHACIINHPRGILSTSSKAYLLKFPTLCPDIRLCSSVEDVLEEAAKYPIVLKPLKEYGGRGLLKINGPSLDDGTRMHDTQEYLQQIQSDIKENNYLSMRFLKNVSQGDKRILVVDGNIMAASLRLPADGSWLCNVAQGGKSVPSTITPEEEHIVKKIAPDLRKRGVLMYGVDTLVDDEGSRVLSEINTLSIGGWPQAQDQSGKPIIKMTIDKLFDYADDYWR